ncbi:D-alanyl-D-alanine carboxypeptidase family protein [Desulfitobacterium sp. AusDCA]|uniref:D-alanyl-D-alanine carboxypeptidase family protein n=1 Tax=Desulfitobacterium sp. AusDCA TaxID=3240383 RepID=UPI003DA7A4BA
MKRNRLIILGLLSSVLFFIFSMNIFSNTSVTSAALAAQPQTPNSIPSNSGLTESLDTPSYYLIDVKNQNILLSQNDTVHRPPASTVKLLTGLVAMQTLNEDDTVTVGNEVLIQDTTLGLKPGDTIKVKDLLTAIYLESANDAAIALAVKAKESLPAFIESMNNYAIELGCKDSHFQTPNGLPASDQYTTAQDLAKIAIKFTQNKTLMDYVRQKEGKVEWTTSNGLKRSIKVYNTNEFLGIYPGVQGLKTGTTTEAGQCLVTYVSRSDGDLILVLLGSRNRYKETKGLLDQGIAALRTRAALQSISKNSESLVQSPGFIQP